MLTILPKGTQSGIGRLNGSDNPDERDKHHIGEPAANDESYDAWKKTGRISGREFDRDVIGDLRRSGMSEKKRAMVEVVGEGFRDNGDLRRGEAIELVNEIKERANRLGLSKGDIGKIERAVGDAVNE